MEIVTLILFGLTVACFFISLLGRGNRNSDLAGAVFGVCSLSAFLLEPWDDYSLIFIAALSLITMFLIAGGVIGDNSE